MAAAWDMAGQTGPPLKGATAQATTTLPMVLRAIVAGTLADCVDPRCYVIVAPQRDIEYGRSDLRAPQRVSGFACIVKRSSPPARICACVITLRASGLPSRVTLPT